MSRLTSSEKTAYKKAMGDEPIAKADYTDSQMIRAYNWMGYYYTDDDAKNFLIKYLEKMKFSRLVPIFSRLPAHELRVLGWNARFITNGGELPADYNVRFNIKITELAASAKKLKVVVEKEDAEPTRNVQDYIRDRASDLNGELEGAFDDLFFDKTIKEFDATKFMRENDVSAPVARHIINKFSPRYASAKNDGEWKPAVAKKVVEFYRDIVAAAEGRVAVAAASRKPRAKKEKPKSVIVAKLHYKAEDKDLNLKSIDPTTVVGAQQLWVFNTKLRKLTVYNAIGSSGLSIKGTSVVGYDETTSVTKTCRKPREQLKPVIDGGKIVLRRHMGTIKAKDAKPSPRLNRDSILLRVLK